MTDYIPLTQEQVERLVRSAPERHRRLIERMNEDEAIRALLAGEPHPEIQRRQVMLKRYTAILEERSNGNIQPLETGD